jgi:hypothetical protein
MAAGSEHSGGPSEETIRKGEVMDDVVRDQDVDARVRVGER